MKTKTTAVLSAVAHIFIVQLFMYLIINLKQLFTLPNSSHYPT